jgi:prepilin-type N-terminal cleavage/methylation domain-containing protein
MLKTNRRSRAFTLIELLVVISIVAVLISILLPALSSARVEGQKLKCATNLRALAQTALTYSNDDPRGIIGPVHPKTQTIPDQPSYDYGGGPGTIDVYQWEHEFDARTRPFNHIIYGPRGVTKNTEAGNRGVFQLFQCPGEELGWQFYPASGVDADIAEKSGFLLTGTAFRQNNLGYTNGFSGGIYGRPINRIPETSLTLSYLEIRAYQSLFVNDAGWGYDPPMELDGYHRRLAWFEIAYCDGHADYKDFGKGTYFPQIPEYQGGDVRGKWGRLDCLPEPAIQFTFTGGGGG